MKSLVIISSILLLSSYHANGHSTHEMSANLSQYVRFTIADPEINENQELFDTIYIDDARGVSYAGDAGIIAEQPCENDWICMDVGFFSIAIPSQCDMIRPDGSWKHRAQEFKPVGTIDRTERDLRKVRHVIEVVGKKGKREGVAVYSEDRGLESFAITERKSRRTFLVHYYLSSPKGVLIGGCAAKRDAENVR